MTARTMAKPRLKINIVANWNHVSMTAIAQMFEYMRASTAIMRAPSGDCVVASEYQRYCAVWRALVIAGPHVRGGVRD